jgi:2-amino-4-hydroxy-6-hydroxymethyldihydropteridine diphosphokinase
MENRKTTYLSLGTNLGNKIENLQSAINIIHKQIGFVSQISSIYKTASWGFSGEDFFNICIEVKTNLSSKRLLKIAQQIEKDLGRKRSAVNEYQNRIIDIDILLFESEIILSEELIVPHSKMLLRNFVLVPLNEIASDIIHPIKRQSIKHCLQEVDDKTEINIIKEKLKIPITLKDKYNYIAIEGNIGAGKTTLAKMLSKDFNTKLVLERFAENPFLPKFYKQKDRYAFPLEMSFLADRYQQITEGLGQFDLFKSFIISDYYIFKSLIFAKITLQKEEFLLYRKLFDIMYKEIMKPDLYVYLHQEPEKLLRNIKKRGRDYEQKIEVNYLEMIHKGYLSYIYSINNLKFIIIDTSNLDFVKSTEDYNLIINKLVSF